MRKKFGILFMLLGVALIGGAVMLLTNNRQEDRQAQAYAQFVLPEIRHEIQQAVETTPAETQPSPAEYVPAELLAPEDVTMSSSYINGYAYIGYLTIGDLGLELPVMADWDYDRLQIAPCRYSGTVKGEDLVIMAHNYSAHFGRLKQLAVGARLQFADMDGKIWQYEVAAMDVLAAENIEEMTAGEYDLTLFTCDTNRTHRVTVRCNLAADK